MLRWKHFLRRQWPSLIPGAMLAALLFNGLSGPKGPRDLLLLRRRYAELEARRSALQARKAELEALVQNLRSNDRYLEHLVRRELGYARPDELVYKFTGGDGAKAASAAKRPRAE